jgi:uncharacterized DUF497 family protein
MLLVGYFAQTKMSVPLHHFDTLFVEHSLLAVIFTERGNAVRIISARKATKQERMLYEQEY